MNGNNEEKNPPKKKVAEKTPKKRFEARSLEILGQAGYRMVNGPFIQAKGDQN